MRGGDYIKLRQRLWGQRRGLPLIHRRSAKGQPGYTQSVDENLFQRLSDRARRQFEDGDGRELGTKGRPGNMQALHSSSAIACNVFHYWQRLADLGDVAGIEPIAAACGLPKPKQAKSISFEAKRRVLDEPDRKKFPKDPNLDVVVEYRSGTEVGIECKFTEAYPRGRRPDLKAAYLQHKELWEGLPETRKLAKNISSDDERDDAPFHYLGAAQLIKHILGLKRRSGRKRPCLLYLWYDVPGEEGVDHQNEIEEFKKVVVADGVWFRAMTYQKLIQSLAEHRGRHPAYVDYLAERYL